MTQIQPLGSRVLTRRLGVGERTSKGGLMLPTKGAPPTYKHEVIAVGDSITKAVAPGSVVIVTQFIGDEVIEGTETYFLIGEDDLLAVIR